MYLGLKLQNAVAISLYLILLSGCTVINSQKNISSAPSVNLTRLYCLQKRVLICRSKFAVLPTALNSQFIALAYVLFSNLWFANRGFGV